MYPGHWASIKPQTAAVVHAETGAQLNWAELNDQSNQLAQMLHAKGLRKGDHVALLMDNQLSYFVIAWATFRSGLYLTCINRYLTADEIAYIVNDSGSQVLFAADTISTAPALPELIPNCPLRISIGDIEGFTELTSLSAVYPQTPLAEEPMGDAMLYSSGTTGRPKGIKRPLTGQSIAEGIPGVERAGPYGIDDDTRYLSPAPLYHAAPFGFCMRTLSLGGTVYMMEKFDAQASLEYIQQFRITHSQWVPTMFVRMLKLPEAERLNFDLSTHQCAIHAAAPCPVQIKQQMMDWWGAILWEYYAGTERNGSTVIGPEEWLAHPGSVGRPRNCIIHICDEDGTEMPIGEPGMVYFEQSARNFEYHNAPEKTQGATHTRHNNWSTLGDVGYLDPDGYLFLTDRKAFMIISGGLNIYPQEVEDALVMHPQVQDVAVFGVPNPDFGEEVKAVVELMPNVQETDALKDELAAYSREKLAAYKLPRSIDFIDALPRLPTGKLYKRLLKDSYTAALDKLQL